MNKKPSPHPLCNVCQPCSFWPSTKPFIISCASEPALLVVWPNHYPSTCNFHKRLIVSNQASYPLFHSHVCNSVYPSHSHQPPVNIAFRMPLFASLSIPNALQLLFSVLSYFNCFTSLGAEWWDELWSVQHDNACSGGVYEVRRSCSECSRTAARPYTRYITDLHQNCKSSMLSSNPSFLPGPNFS